MAGFHEDLARLAETLRPGSRVTGVRRLRGGLDALTHRFDLVAPAGGRDRLVVRRLKGSWVQPGDAGNEAGILAAVHGAGAPAPGPVWHDEGAHFGLPAVVMTRLPGRTVVDPAAGSWWVDGIAEVLARIHAVDGAGLPGIAHDTDWLPDWLARAPKREATPEGRAVIGRLRAEAARLFATTGSGRLVHGDFHAGNVVFNRATATGAVDWNGARAGWAGRDVGYCRVDLAIMAGGDTPDAFLAAYERHAGEPVADLAFWDLFGAAMALPDPAAWLPSWLEWGRTDLTPDLVRQRLTAWIGATLARA